MIKHHLRLAIVFLATLAVSTTLNYADGADLVLYSRSLAPHGEGQESRTLKLDGLFFQTAQGVTQLPSELYATIRNQTQIERRVTVSDGHTVTLRITREGK